MEGDKVNDDGTVTLGDLIAEYDAVEDEVDAVLSELSEDWGKEGECTFDRGYYEQPVYSCLTCQALHPGVDFGFCFGCSMRCHVDHEVIELFRKRHFKCDCPTTKLHEGCCQLRERYDDVNDENTYGHNYRGKYCYCDSAYNMDQDDVMLQCFVCSDWFHDHCIKEKLIGPFLNDGSSALICRNCSERYEFLRKYPELFAKAEVIVDSPLMASETNSSNSTPTLSSNQTPSKVQLTCKIADKKVAREAGDMFMVEGFEKELCRCQKCLDHYYLKDVSFLVEEAEAVPPLPTNPANPNPSMGPPLRLETGFGVAPLSDREAMGSVAVQIEIAHRAATFKRKFSELVARAAQEGRAFSLEDVERLKSELGITTPSSSSSSSNTSSSNGPSDEPPHKKRRYE